MGRITLYCTLQLIRKKNDNMIYYVKNISDLNGGKKFNWENVIIIN